MCKILTVISSVKYNNQKRQNHLKEQAGQIIVPKAAIKENGSKVTVNKYNEGKIETVEIIKGIESGSNVEVISGLNVGHCIN